MEIMERRDLIVVIMGWNGCN